MNTNKDNQYTYWEWAGESGYGNAMFSSGPVEQHIRTTIWDAAIKTAGVIGLHSKSRILELGCGDGSFAGTVLAKNFFTVDGYDYSTTGIKRAESMFGSEAIRFYAADVRELAYSPEQYWDGAFLMGFLHHVKESVPAIVSRLAQVAPRVVVVDPNGDNLIRKALECFPSYRCRGEDSFILNQLKSIFDSVGYKLVSKEIVSLVPPFTPEFLLGLMVRMEKVVDSNSLLTKLNSTYVLGFELK